MKIIKKSLRLDLIMPKYCLFIQCRERIEGSQIAKCDLVVSLVCYPFLT